MEDFLHLITTLPATHPKILRINMLIQQFGENISKTRPELTLSTTNCWIKSILGIDQSGFYLAPHVDSVDSLINLLFFVPYPKSNPDIGTVLYQPTPEITSQILTAKNKFPSKYYKEEYFTEVYRAPYKSNLLFGMINSPLGFHGVKKLENMKSDRRHIQWILSLNEKKIYPSALDKISRGEKQEDSLRNRRLLELLEAKKLNFGS